MNREWYNIDVKREVLNDIRVFLQNNDLGLEVMDVLKNVSVRDMMDLDFVTKLEGIENPEVFSKYVSDRYMHYRGEKYGQEGFCIGQDELHTAGCGHGNCSVGFYIDEWWRFNRYQLRPRHI